MKDPLRSRELGEGVHVLLVEDQDLNADMLRRRLQKRGFRVSRAVDGEEALHMTAELQPDLVLMDMSLPVLDGWEATRRIKADPGQASIPVLALTAHAMGDDRQKALDAGCDDYDTKPVDLRRLLRKMLSLLGREVD
ncbi:MAG: response regulator [Thermoanaerobaculia bacterium]|nr:response regulator [Thermoanaerobaculia bacterium]